jgi:hypothetical protein
MPAIARVDLAIDDYTLTTTAGTSAGVSSTLTQGAEYLVFASGNAQTAVGSDIARAEFLVGGTVFGRSSSTCGYDPVAGLGGRQNGATTQLGTVFAYTPGGSDLLEFRAWSEGAGEGAQFRASALDLTSLGPADWNYIETANNDTIVDQPLATDGWVALGGGSGALTFTPVATGDWLIFAAVEAEPQAGVVATNEFGIRVTVDGTVVSGSEVGGNVNGFPTDQIYGYLTHDVVSLTGGSSHTIQIEANGAAGGGNVGFRRIRIHALRVSAFDTGAVIHTTQSSHTLTGTSDADVLSTSLGMGTSGDYLLFARAQKSVSFWGDSGFLINGTRTPDDGFGVAGVDLGTGVGNDLLYEQAMHIAPSLADGDSLGVRIRRLGGGGSNTYGTDVARPGGGDMSLIAFRLETLPNHFILGTTSSSSGDTAALSARRSTSATSTATSTNDTGSLTSSSDGVHALVGITDSIQQDFGRLIMDPILDNVISGPIEAHYPGTSESLPWYCNPTDSALTLIERVKRPAVTNGTTVVLPEAAPDMNSVSAVAVQYWDDAQGAGWTNLAGEADVVITDEVDDDGAPFWDLRFRPDPAVLANLQGRLRRRWVLSITGGTTMNVPQKGHGIMVVNEDPPVAAE